MRSDETTLMLASSLTTAGFITLQAAYGYAFPQATFVAGTRNWTFLLDGSAVQTANLTVQIDVVNPVNATLWVTPTLIGGQTNPFTITFGTGTTGSVFLVTHPGPLSAARIDIVSFGTSTGTFRGAIWAC